MQQIFKEDYLESLRLVFNEIQRNKSAAECKIDEGFNRNYLGTHNSLDGKINTLKIRESSLILLYTSYIHY